MRQARATLTCGLPRVDDGVVSWWSKAAWKVGAKVSWGQISLCLSSQVRKTAWGGRPRHSTTAQSPFTLTLGLLRASQWPTRRPRSEFCLRGSAESLPRNVARPPQYQLPSQRFLRKRRLGNPLRKQPRLRSMSHERQQLSHHRFDGPLPRLWRRRCLRKSLKRSPCLPPANLSPSIFPPRNISQ